MDFVGKRVGELKRIIVQVDDDMLVKQYDVYRTMQARGVNDEVVLSLLEREIDLRGIRV